MEETKIKPRMKDIEESNGYDNKLLAKCDNTNEETVTSDYILSLDATKDNNPNIVIATANKSCLAYTVDDNRIAKVWEYNKYSTKVIDCRFSHGNTNLLYTVCTDGSISVLDLRTPQNFAIKFKDTAAENGDSKVFNCFDISSNDKLLAAGTDVYGGDAYILFWDTRNTNLLGGYWESHDDDITQVRFHPDDMNKFISGSTDGLINVYDLSQSSEDDALMDTLNMESSVHELLWFKKMNKDCISCITHTCDLQLWDMDNGEPYKALSRLELAEKIMGCSEEFYISKCHNTKDGLLVLAGADCSFRASQITKTQLKPCIEFTNNKQIVRDSVFNENNNVLITGGEKGLLNIWKIAQPL